MTTWFILAALLLIADVQTVMSQVSPPITSTTGSGSLGTIVTTQDHVVQITGGIRPDNGTNLFHSFGEFSVPNNNIANFLNDSGSATSNILGRVTGGNVSNIFGTIQTSGFGNATLFLMNPAGIIFGPNATLNVGGSVAFTTADYLRLGEGNGSNGGIFYADPTGSSLLADTPIAAFGFLNSNPGAISVQESTLQLPSGQSLSLVAGNQTLMGAQLLAQSGYVNIASVASSGEIPAGALPQISNRIGGSDNGIIIRGGQLVLNNSKITTTAGDISLDASSILITNGTEIATSTSTAANAGHISIRASENIEISSGAIVGSRSDNNATGHSGNVLLSSSRRDIRLADVVFVSTQAKETSSGDAGRITFDAPNGNILLSNQAFIFNSALGTGKLKGIQLTANNLLLEKSSQITGDNFTPLTGESINIMLKGDLIITGGSAIATGTFTRPNKPNLIVASADLNIGASNIFVADNSLLYAGTTTDASGGTIRMNATDAILMTNGASISAESAGPGNAGSIFMAAGEGLHLTEKSSITTEALPDSSGSSGSIGILTKTLTMENGGVISASNNGFVLRNTGGSITVNVTDQVSLTNGATITASSTGPADAGKIFIDSGQRLMMRDSSITTQASKAGGGSITILASDELRLTNSVTSTSVMSDTGSAGNIFIDPKVVILQNSQILSQAVLGNGGNITVVTPVLLMDDGSTIDASSQLGRNGVVNSKSNLSGSVGQLVSKTSQPQVLLQNRCLALAGGQESTFIVSGRDALPTEPGGWLSSPVSLEHWTGEEKEHASGLMVRSRGSNGMPPMVTSNDATSVLSLRRLTPPGFLVRSFATAPTGCRS